MIATCRPATSRRRSIASFRTSIRKEARFWNSQLQIVGIEDIRETAVLPGPRSLFRAGSVLALR